MGATKQTILLSACLLGLAAAASSSGEQDQSQGRAIFSNYTSGTPIITLNTYKLSKEGNWWMKVGFIVLPLHRYIAI